MDKNVEGEDKTQASAYCQLYKSSMQIDQNKRRTQLLAEQKLRRENLLDDRRGIDTSENSNNSQHYQHYNKKVKEYKNKIMLSEWLIETPQDFDVSWFIKICPEGHRNLVVAQKNSTKTYSKSGRFEYKFKSMLPGGSYNNDNQTLKTTIIDCIWNEKTNTFYILDVLVWAGYDVTEYDAEFRFFWLQSRVSEIPELEILSSNNTYSFKYVSHLPCDHLLLRETFEKFPYYDNDLPSIDGYLFYHKEASYTSGRTPLVGWLKPFMATEILGIPVASEYLSMKPERYVNLAQHIEYAKQTKKKTNNIKMEVS